MYKQGFQLSLQAFLCCSGAGRGLELQSVEAVLLHGYLITLGIGPWTSATSNSLKELIKKASYFFSCQVCDGGRGLGWRGQCVHTRQGWKLQGYNKETTQSGGRAWLERAAQLLKVQRLCIKAFSLRHQGFNFKCKCLVSHSVAIQKQS